MPSPERIKAEGERIVLTLKRAKFEKGIPLSRQFVGLTNDPGIYALKSETGDILYVGMANCFLTRFRGGHQTLVALYCDGIPSESVRIVTEPLRGRWLDYMLQLEKLAIFTFQPPYNTRIPSVAEITAMYTTTPKPPQATLKIFSNIFLVML
jgi:excinuclease UvrABC nuclease subunit